MRVFWQTIAKKGASVDVAADFKFEYKSRAIMNRFSGFPAVKIVRPLPNAVLNEAQDEA